MSRFRFDLKAKRMKSGKSGLLDRMANNAIYEFKVVSFDKRSFDGKAWEPNKTQEGRQQLVKTGRMRQGFVISRRTSDSRDITNNVLYFEYHNAGTSKMPKRQMMGKTKNLTRKNDLLIKAYLRTTK